MGIIVNILALNTAFTNSDVAVLYNDKKDYISLDSSAKHSENILVCVDELLKKNNATIQNIDIMSCVVGPGSFTGVRIGVGLIKGMYVAKPKLKLISICSLDLMAYANKDAKGEFWCVLDALSGNIFVCKYDQNGNRLTEPTMLTGENIDTISGEIVGLKQENLDLCNKFVEFSSQLLLDYTIQQADKNAFIEENNFLPIYLRKSQAEVSLENGNKKD